MLSIALMLATLRQDVDQVLQQGEVLLAEAKAAYEDAKAKNSPEAFTAAAFKLEGAKAKFAAVQEFAEGDRKKTAAERLQLVVQLARLINDGKAAAAAKPPPPPPAAPPPIPAVPPPAPTPTAAPLPPEAARQAEIEKSVRDLFKADYAKKSPADRRALARTLLAEAARPGQDPATLWVLCREAQEAAATAGDAALAAEAVDVLGLTFAIDVVSLKMAAFATASKAAKTPEELALAAGAYVAVAETAAAADLYETADKALAAAAPLAKRGNDAALASRIAALAKEVAALKPRAEALKRAREALAKNPADAAANLELGRFLCLVKGNWEEGLVYLAKAGDAALGPPAERDRSAPSAPGEQLSLGDAWWGLSEKEKEPARSRLRERAASWYERALPGLTGVDAVRIEKRLREHRTVDLLALIDPRQDGYVGAWRMSGNTLISPPESRPSKMSLLRIPYAPPAEYDLKMTVECKQAGESGFRSIDVGLLGGGGPYALIFDGWGGGIYLNTLEGQSPDQNPASYRTRVFGAGVSRAIVVGVRRTGVTVAVDGKPLVQWQGDPSRLRAIYQAATDHGAMFVATWITYQVSKMELVPAGAEPGRRTR